MKEFETEAQSWKKPLTKIRASKSRRCFNDDSEAVPLTGLFMPPAILASLFSRARFLFLLRYALAFYDVKYLTDYNLLQLENIIPLGLVDIRNKYYVKSADYELWTSKIEIQEGDLLITNAGRVGEFSRVPKGIRAGIGRNITAIRPQQVLAIYFYYYLHSVDCKRQIRLNTDVGAFFDSLNVKGLKNMYVLLPPQRLMQLFDKQGGHCRERLESAAQESERLVALRDWLLPMLMNGQVGFKAK